MWQSINRLVTLALLFSTAPIPGAVMRARSVAPYVGIIYHEPEAGIIGLPHPSGGYLAWFVRAGPPYGLNVTGGAWFRRVVTLASGAHGDFLLASSLSGGSKDQGTRIWDYNPGTDKVVSRITLPGVRVAANAPNAVQLGGADHLWVLGVVDDHVILYCIGSINGKVEGRFDIPQGSRGVLFWPTATGALIAVADHPGPGAGIASLFYMTPKGVAHTVVIPKRLQAFPPLAAIRHGHLCGVNARWDFARVAIGISGHIQPRIMKHLDVDTKAVGRPGYYFPFGNGQAVISALGNWNRRRLQFMHRYLFLISDRTGVVLHVAVIPAYDQPIGAAKGKIYCLTRRGAIKVFGPNLNLRTTFNAMNPLFAVQGAINCSGNLQSAATNK